MLNNGSTLAETNCCIHHGLFVVFWLQMQIVTVFSYINECTSWIPKLCRDGWILGLFVNKTIIKILTQIILLNFWTLQLHLLKNLNYILVQNIIDHYRTFSLQLFYLQDFNAVGMYTVYTTKGCRTNLDSRYSGL